MDIKKAKYYADPIRKENTSISIETRDMTWSVPIDTDNAMYQEILKWVAEGNTIEPADE